MDAFIARQPIFDRRLGVYAYELLFRSGFKDFFDHPDPDQATSKVIADSLLLPGLDSMTGGRPAFINVTRELLVGGGISLMPASTTVVEILETVEPDREVLEACRMLKGKGYLLALDDFACGSPWEPWLELADIVKVDVIASGPAARATLARRFKHAGPRLLAEKVETQAIHLETSGLGYQFFQGFFFERPTTLSARDIPTSKLHEVQLLREIHRSGLDFPALEGIIEHEVGLSYKLLRYINAAFFGWRGSVDSIRHALMLLGEREIRNWASVVVMAGMASDKPDELVTQALMRGRHCELLAPAAGLESRAHDLFLMGTFSLIDAILDCPLASVLREIPIAPDIKDALLGEPGPLRDLFTVVVAYAGGDWALVSERAKRLGLDEAAIPVCYIEALRWCDESLERTEGNRAA
jgi:EAL and modified HD-GYP domain-containing signal transduction protein